MSMDVAILGKEITAFLTPFLPDLVKMGGIAAGEASKKLSADAFESAKALWGKLRPKVEAKPAAQEAVNDVVAAPKDEDAQAALRVQIKKILAEDENLADEVSRIWEKAKVSNVKVIASGDRSVAIGGNVDSSVIVTGDNNQVR
jgi:hypothetical protein